MNACRYSDSFECDDSCAGDGCKVLRQLEPKLYHRPLSDIAASLPKGCSLKIVTNGRLTNFFATRYGLTMDYRWNGKEWAANTVVETELKEAPPRGRCASCRFWVPSPTEVPGCAPEKICGRTQVLPGDLYGQDGRSVITTAEFGCIHWRGAALPEIPAAGVEALQPLVAVPWDGFWDLDKDEEMLAMLKMLSKRHTPVLVLRNGDYQMGWKGMEGETWGMRLPCPRRAIRDAAQRLFKRMKGQSIVNGDQPPNLNLPGVQVVDAAGLLGGSAVQIQEVSSGQ